MRKTSDKFQYGDILQNTSTLENFKSHQNQVMSEKLSQPRET